MYSNISLVTKFSFNSSKSINRAVSFRSLIWGIEYACAITASPVSTIIALSYTVSFSSSILANVFFSFVTSFFYFFLLKI